MATLGGFPGTRWTPRAFVVGAFTLAVAVFPPQLSAGEACEKKGKPAADLSVTTQILDLDSGGLVSTIASDGQGVYNNNVGGVSSVLTANVCNGLTWGDWRFNSQGSTRSVTESFFSPDAVQLGEPGAQSPFVAANPPYFGSQLQQPIINVQCTCTAHQNMYTMTTVGQTFTCPLVHHWVDSAGDAWGVAPARSFTGFPETTDAQVTCNTVSGGHCVDWFIDPIGAPANQAIGRLVETPNCRHCSQVNDGDFRMRFRIHVSLP